MANCEPSPVTGSETGHILAQTRRYRSHIAPVAAGRHLVENIGSAGRRRLTRNSAIPAVTDVSTCKPARNRSA